MSALGGVRRLISMERRELAFRITTEARKRAGQLRVATLAPKWNRRAFPSLLALDGSATPELQECHAAAERGEWLHAHRAFAAHMLSSTRPFALDARAVGPLAAHINERFPAAAGQASATADRILQGRYDLLGYRDLRYGSPPRWNYDPAHDRCAAGGYWASIPYLEPENGDHKVIWEINRHQHFLALGRAFHLTGDRRYYREFVAQFDDWLHANPPLQGVNWSSMLELAFRTLSWLWALHLFAPAAGIEDETPWTIDLIVGLDRQLTHIDENLSRYFSPNTHLTGEALALYVASLCLPELRPSARRMVIGGDVLVQEATRQVRPDGGHAELSAHYHRYSTDFYVLAAQIARAAGEARAVPLTASAAQQAEYLRAIADDDGRLPLLGDDDGGQLFPMCGTPPWDCRPTLASAAVLLDRPHLQIGATPEEAYWLWGSRIALADLDRRSPASMQRQSVALRDSGYYVIRGDAGDHLVFDAGPHGFLNGGHAHSDALSVVLTVGGCPLLVDPGTATYTMDPALRDLFRSTAMHNTVALDGRPQSVPRGPFHWQSSVDARGVTWQSESRFTYAEGAHDGYAPARHVRGVLAVPGFGWFIIDHVVGTGRHVADAYWHLHPDWAASDVEATSLTLTHASGRAVAMASSASLEMLNSHARAGLHLYAPEYGQIDRGTVLRARLEAPLPFSFATFVPAASRRARIQPIAVTRMPDASWHAAAFRVTSDHAEVELLSAVPLGAGSEAPGVRWGTDSAVTDGRVALVTPAGAPIVVHGSVTDGVLAPTVHHP